MNVSILEYASERTTLKKISGEYAGPCPVCGGTDRFHIFRDGTGWVCRKCRPQSGGVYDLIAACEGISLEQAMRLNKREYARVEKKAPVTKSRDGAPGDWQTSAWQDKAREIVTKGVAALPGSSGAAYLASRAISEETCAAYRIGFDPAWPTKYEKIDGRVQVVGRSAAVIIPWILDGLTICAIKIRLLGERDKNDRFRQVKGGNQIIFGANTVHTDTRRRTLVAVEGEFNCASIYQVARGELDVVSIGGDTNKRAFATIAPLYGRKLVWMDAPEKAAAMHESVQDPTTNYMVSPDGLDANDILRTCGADVLRGLILRRLE